MLQTLESAERGERNEGGGFGGGFRISNPLLHHLSYPYPNPVLFWLYKSYLNLDLPNYPTRLSVSGLLANSERIQSDKTGSVFSPMEDCMYFWLFAMKMHICYIH